MQEYVVYRMDGRERLGEAGRVRLDDDKRLSLVRAAPDAAEALRAAIEELNGKDGLVIKLPPEAGDPKFSLRKEMYMRADARFFDALQDNLRRWHSLELAAP